MRSLSFAATLLAVLVALSGCGGDSSRLGGNASGGAGGDAAAGDVTLKVLSNRADLLNSGDALVEVLLANGVSAEGLKLDVDGRDVTAAVQRRSNGRLMGLVTGLPLGTSTLRARLANGRGSRIALSNHPQGGPVFSGPQVQPWLCVTADNGLGTALDAQCNGKTFTELQYKSVVTQSFAAYDPASPPRDLATATTTDGVTVPYIVRIETGTMNRGIYKLAVLFDPAKPWTPWEPQAGWNHKIMWLFGGGTAPFYTQDAAPSPLDDNALSSGFMVATGSMNVHGSNSNDNVSAESVMMLKERIAEQYGEIKFTIGEGCSGGGLQQHLIASQYPGLLDGLIPTCSYPDVWTTATEVVYCNLLNRYFTQTSPQMWAALPQQSEVMGHSSIASCQAWDATFATRFDPTVAANCNLPEAMVYNPVSNPEGARCTISDHMISVLGPRVPAVWEAVEKKRGKGFANRPVSNLGVQFGLTPLLSKLITPEQFVDLNEKIGGLDIDGQPMAGRNPIDPGSAALSYRAALLSDARQLARVPIIDLRGHDDVEIHTDDWTYAVRARLDRHNGGHGNQIIFTGAVPLVGDPAFACGGGISAGLGAGTPLPATPAGLCTHNPLLLMNRWLDAVHADTGAGELPEKVLRNRPADAVDTCFIAGAPVTNAAACAAAYPHYSNPLVQAGGPVATDNIDCQLKPLKIEDYAAALPSMTAAQFARLQAVFPRGVCDWSKPSNGDQPSVPWLGFGAGPGGVPLGAPPVAQAIR